MGEDLQVDGTGGSLGRRQNLEALFLGASGAGL